MLATLTGVRWYLIVVLICISLMNPWFSTQSQGDPSTCLLSLLFTFQVPLLLTIFVFTEVWLTNGLALHGSDSISWLSLMHLLPPISALKGLSLYFLFKIRKREREILFVPCVLFEPAVCVLELISLCILGCLWMGVLTLV